MEYKHLISCNQAEMLQQCFDISKVQFFVKSFIYSFYRIENQILHICIIRVRKMYYLNTILNKYFLTAMMATFFLIFCHVFFFIPTFENVNKKDLETCRRQTTHPLETDTGQFVTPTREQAPSGAGRLGTARFRAPSTSH